MTSQEPSRAAVVHEDDFQVEVGLLGDGGDLGVQRGRLSFSL